MKKGEFNLGCFLAIIMIPMIISLFSFLGVGINFLIEGMTNTGTVSNADNYISLVFGIAFTIVPIFMILIFIMVFLAIIKNAKVSGLSETENFDAWNEVNLNDEVERIEIDLSVGNANEADFSGGIINNGDENDDPIQYK